MRELQRKVYNSTERYERRPLAAVLNFRHQYLVPWARIGTQNLISQDEEVGKKLWAWLEEQVHT
jgi:hypothetical protein